MAGPRARWGRGNGIWPTDEGERPASWLGRHPPVHVERTCLDRSAPRCSGPG